LKNSKNNALGCGKLPMFSKTILEDWHEMEPSLLQQH
jgi:hypothetical protein